MPRRIYTYEPGRGWDTLNLHRLDRRIHPGRRHPGVCRESVVSYWKGARAGNDPWDAWTLEWSTSSPPPAYNFATIPTVASRRPLWDLKASGRPGQPLRVKGASRWTAVADDRTAPADRRRRGRCQTAASSAWLSFIIAESAIFTIFVVAYLFYLGKSLTGPTPRDVLEVPIFYTICLLSSSVTIHLAGRRLERNESRTLSRACGCSPLCLEPSSCSAPRRNGAD